MRVFKTRWMTRFVRRERIADSALAEAIIRAERGLIDADLGGGLIKQRVARQGRGRSGGYRMIIGYRAQERAVFLFGFAKNDFDNVHADQLNDLRLAGQAILACDGVQIDDEVRSGNLSEVLYG